MTFEEITERSRALQDEIARINREEPEIVRHIEILTAIRKTLILAERDIRIETIEAAWIYKGEL